MLFIIEEVVIFSGVNFFIDGDVEGGGEKEILRKGLKGYWVFSWDCSEYKWLEEGSRYIKFGLYCCCFRGYLVKLRIVLFVIFFFYTY